LIFFDLQPNFFGMIVLEKPSHRVITSEALNQMVQGEAK